MRRPAYVDSSGNKVSNNENLKFRISVYFVISIILPVVIIGFMIYQVIANSTCNNTYNKLKTASKDYLTSENKLPSFEGESEEVNVSDLYEKEYVSPNDTNKTECSGKIKVTRYKKDYVYTLNLTSCNSCTVTKRYSGWSNEQNSYPFGKSIVDVIPYYNYYEREIGQTEWTSYYDDEKLTEKIDKNYNTRVPANNALPPVPSDVKIVGLETEQKTLYSYQDKLWKWYDIVGQYSGFSSAQPTGYASKDTSTERLSDWSNYSYSKPEEKEYRTIVSRVAYKYYYLDDNGHKVYYNNGKYTVEADREKYPFMDEETTTMFSYQDKVWRWYNGQKRMYSSYVATPPSTYKYKDEELYNLGSASTWSDKSSVTAANVSYRVEKSKIQTRFRIKYEVSSLPIFEKPVDRDTFLKRIDMAIPKFARDDGVRVEVTYKFRYRKS